MRRSKKKKKSRQLIRLQNSRFFFSKGQVALEDKTVYLCQKSVITIKNQVRPVCSPKDKIWSRTDKLQRYRRLPLEQAKLRQILESNNEEMIGQVIRSRVSML